MIQDACRRHLDSDDQKVREMWSQAVRGSVSVGIDSHGQDRLSPAASSAGIPAQPTYPPPNQDTAHDSRKQPQGEESRLPPTREPKPTDVAG